jgi:hypothetical protein
MVGGTFEPESWYVSKGYKIDNIKKNSESRWDDQLEEQTYKLKKFTDMDIEINQQVTDTIINLKGGGLRNRLALYGSPEQKKRKLSKRKRSKSSGSSSNSSDSSSPPKEKSPQEIAQEAKAKAKAEAAACKARKAAAKKAEQAEKAEAKKAMQVVIKQEKQAAKDRVCAHAFIH